MRAPRRGHVKQAFKERMQNNSWMTEVTKQQALAKLDAFDVQVGTK